MKKILIAEDDRPLQHVLRNILSASHFSVVGVQDGVRALDRLSRGKFDVALLDVGLPRMSGLEVLASVRALGRRPKVIVMTADDTPATVLRAIRDQAYQYVTKPFPPKDIVDIVEKALAVAAEPAEIEVLSARPDWVELLVPCQLEAADRIQNFLMRLKTDLPEEVRESVGKAFHELLLNAIEWGGKLDPSRKVRIAYLRGRRMLLYRIADPGPGFSLENLEHAAVSYPPERPCDHLTARKKKGLRPGGFGLLMVQQMVDELLYNEARNEVLFVKYTEETGSRASLSE
jgi:CheY-like chemotaxis protein